MVEIAKTALLAIDLGLSGMSDPEQAVRSLVGSDTEREQRVLRFLVQLGTVSNGQWADLPRIKAH